MSDDFVARLRRYDQVGPKTIITEAADEIERLSKKVLELERENERLVDIMRGAAPLIEEFQREAN